MRERHVQQRISEQAVAALRAALGGLLVAMIEFGSLHNVLVDTLTQW